MQLQFVPVRDEQLFDARDAFRATLVPFSVDFECHHWLQDDAGPNAEREGHDVQP